MKIDLLLHYSPTEDAWYYGYGSIPDHAFRVTGHIVALHDGKPRISHFPTLPEEPPMLTIWSLNKYGHPTAKYLDGPSSGSACK